MTTTTSPTNAREVAIDTQLADLYEARGKAAYYRHSALKSLAYAVGFRLKRGESLPPVEDILSEAKGNDHYNVVSALTSFEKHDAEVKTIREQEKPLEDQYTGWSRFFLVNNSNGHIHSSMRCSTCFIDTEFSWLPGLSGLTEKDAVEAYGCILCSVCFPSAPVEWTNGISLKDQAAKDERAAAKTEREAAKAAKAITNPDGSPLEDNYGYTIKTEVTARRELSDAYFNLLLGYNADRYNPLIERLVAAIAFKTGESADDIKAAHKAKAAKKYKKEMN